MMPNFKGLIQHRKANLLKQFHKGDYLWSQGGRLMPIISESGS